MTNRKCYLKVEEKSLKRLDGWMIKQNERQTDMDRQAD